MYDQVHLNPKRGCLSFITGSLGIVISILYLLNLGTGIFEILPDNLPIIGNLDEAFFTALLIGSLSVFGIQIPFLSKDKIIPPSSNHQIRTEQ